MKKPFKLLTGLFSLCLLTAPAYAETNIFVVLDGSNSMWGQVDGKAKIETALGTLYQSVDSFPENSKAGLIAYGHREEKNCQDIQTLLPLSSLSKQSFIKSTENFTPKGKTPIAESLVYTASQFKNNDANNNVVLISDGIETCGGDPCTTIKKLREEDGLNIDVHVIGFDVDKAAEEQLKCIADAGNGKYITASSNQGLEDAFTEVTKTVKVREEEFIAKQKPESTRNVETDKVIFEDSFDKDLAAEDWSIALENEMFHSIGEGNLSIANANELQNVFMLNRPLPKGDWQATAEIQFSVQTGEEIMRLGLFQDENNYVFSQINLEDGTNQQIFGNFFANFNDDEKKSGRVEIFDLDWCQEMDENGKRIHDHSQCWAENWPLNKFLKDNIVHMKLIKEGKVLKAFVKFEYESDKGWFPIGEFPLFKPFGQIALSFNSGERNMSTGHFKHFKLETLDITE